MAAKSTVGGVLACVLAHGVLLAPGSLAGDETGQNPHSEAAASAPREPKLLVPTQGRPVFVQPGGSLDVVAHVPDAAGLAFFELVTGGFPLRRHRLAAADDATERLASGAAITLALPEKLPEKTYDLEIRCGDARLVGRHCVAVGRFPERVRLVHLSNMNIGDPSAPDFDWRLIDEVNLVSPTLILVTGDLLDATHDAPHHGWQRLTEFLGRFDAPALIACGDHDGLEYYSQFIAPSPVGTIVVGGFRGVVLFDLPSRPIGDDPEQVQWVERTFAVPGEDRPSFVIAHDISPNLLHEWQRRGVLPEMVRATRLGVWFSGGHRDWDGIEYGGLVAAAAPLLYLRTHQSSTAVREGAEGISHYRVVDLVGVRATLPGADHTPGAIPPSIPVGRLSVSFDGPNDGTRRRLGFTAVNNLPFPMTGLSVRVLLEQSDQRPPWCLGADLDHVADLGKYWECRVRFDLPDKGALRAVVGTGARPGQPDVEVRFDAVPRLPLIQQTNRAGLSFLSATDAIVLVHLRNRGGEVALVTPLVRLDGETLAYAVLDAPGPVATAYRLRIAPERTLTLHVDLTAIRVAPGRRELQVYLKGPAAWRPVCCPLEVTVAPAPT